MNDLIGLAVFCGADAAKADSTVLAVQRALLARGFKLPRYGANGSLGNETRAAITAFWESRSVSHAPVIDQALLDALGIRGASPEATPAAARKEKPAAPPRPAPAPPSGEAPAGPPSGEEKKPFLSGTTGYIVAGGLVAAGIALIVYGVSGRS